jgi:hypothetical protein
VALALLDSLRVAHATEREPEPMDDDEHPKGALR